MLYGLYLSATGVMTNSYRQDVIANNLANAETVGFKKDMALFSERKMASQEGALQDNSSDPMLDHLTGGLWARPTIVDTSQGELESTGRDLDLGLQGPGYFMTQGTEGQRLTRDGRMTVDAKTGNLILAHSNGQQVLDRERKPIAVDPGSKIEVGVDGQLRVNGKNGPKLGVFDVPKPELLTKEGASMFKYLQIQQATNADSTTVSKGFTERANVDPTLELTQLMDAQRQLEANASMIKYQDTTLGLLVSNVGKIS